MKAQSNPATGSDWFARQRGWMLRRGSVMVEGALDVGYFECAAKSHLLATGLKLIGSDFSVFPAGNGDEGGTYGVSERFPALFELTSVDLDAAGKRRFRPIALLDDDNMGRAAVAGITKSGSSGFCVGVFRVFRA